jgi:hypothetical protein
MTRIRLRQASGVHRPRGPHTIAGLGLRLHPPSSFELRPTPRCELIHLTGWEPASLGVPSLPAPSPPDVTDRLPDLPAPHPQVFSTSRRVPPDWLAGLFHPAGTPRVPTFEGLTPDRSSAVYVGPLPLRRYLPSMDSFRCVTRFPLARPAGYAPFPIFAAPAPRHLAMSGFHPGLRPTLRPSSRSDAPPTPNGFTRPTRWHLLWPSSPSGVHSPAALAQRPPPPGVWDPFRVLLLPETAFYG